MNKITTFYFLYLSDWSLESRNLHLRTNGICFDLSLSLKYRKIYLWKINKSYQSWIVFMGLFCQKTFFKSAGFFSGKISGRPSSLSQFVFKWKYCLNQTSILLVDMPLNLRDVRQIDLETKSRYKQAIKINSGKRFTLKKIPNVRKTCKIPVCLSV